MAKIEKTLQSAKEKLNKMIETVKKVDFTRKNLEKMQPNDSIIVLHDDFLSTESTLVMCSVEKSRYPREDVAKYACERNKETFAVQITAIGK